MNKIKSELIVALDNMSPKEAHAVVDELSRVGVRWFKVGLELYTKSGPSFIEELKSKKLRTFLDLKLYDIPNTVAKAVQAAADTGADLLTVHCSGGPEMLHAAQAAAAQTSIKLLGVTVLTSFDDKSFQTVSEAWGQASERKNMARIPRGAVALRLAELAAQAGLPGIVCSVSDLHDGQLQRLNWTDKQPLFVTPGIRGTNDAVDDQKSVASVDQAILVGSTHLVIGRPITAPKNISREEAARSFLRQIEGSISHGVTSFS